MATRLKLKMGLTRVSKPIYASEPGFVQKVNRQMDALKDDLQYIMDQFADVTPDVVLEALQPTFEKSQVYVPKKTGDLKESGYLEVTSRSRSAPSVEMGYGRGGDPRYAVYVHELTTYHHEAPTRAKFLEAAINEDTYQIIDRIFAGYSRFMNG